MMTYAVVDDALSPDFLLGDALEVFIRREDAERFIDEVRGDDPEVAARLRIEERAAQLAVLPATEYSRHSPGTPFSSATPRSRN